ncbi:hypothetical protein Tco_1387667, partial [Tanacetum coccineum]
MITTNSRIEDKKLYVVPTGKYVVLAGKLIIIVSPGRLSLVPTGRILSP